MKDRTFSWRTISSGLPSCKARTNREAWYAHTQTQTQSCNPVNKKVRSIHKQASKHSLKREARQNEREIAIASKHQAEEHPVENERKYTKERRERKREKEKE